MNLRFLGDGRAGRNQAVRFRARVGDSQKATANWSIGQRGARKTAGDLKRAERHGGAAMARCGWRRRVVGENRQGWGNESGKGKSDSGKTKSHFDPRKTKGNDAAERPKAAKTVDQAARGGARGCPGWSIGASWPD
ncbi:hypothetical protein D3C87_1720010 [compost metagenome]